MKRLLIFTVLLLTMWRPFGADAARTPIPAKGDRAALRTCLLKPACRHSLTLRTAFPRRPRG